MRTIRVTNFGGVVPRLGARNLPDNNAQLSENTKLFSGELRAWNRGRKVATVGVDTPRTVYRYDYQGAARFLAFQEPTWVVKAPLINETLGRLYWAGSQGVKYNSAQRIEAALPPYNLGVPTPTVNASVSAVGGASELITTRVYIVALVGPFGEEGPTSLPFKTSGKVDASWVVNGLDSVTFDNARFPAVTRLRLYRTVTSDTGVDYRRVAEWPISSIPSTFEDTVPDTQVAVAPVYESFDWTPPPPDLTGIISVAGGFLAGFRGRELWFSVPYFPHAWPESYKLAVEDDIVALGTFGNVVVVTTKGEPYAAVGSNPAVMTLSKYDKVLPCVSAQGLVATSGAVLYPSYDGLVSISSDGYRIISQPYVTKDEWLSRFSPRGIRASVYQDRYFAFFNSKFGFTIGFDDPSTGFTSIELDGVSSVDLDRTTGQTLVTIGRDVYEWDDDRGDRLVYQWKSKPFLIPKPANFAVLQLRGDFIQVVPGWGTVTPPVVDVLGHGFNMLTYNGRKVVSTVAGQRGPVGFPFNGPGVPGKAALIETTVRTRVWCDGTLMWEGSVDSERPYRLPSGRKGVLWEIELEGKTAVFSATISTTAIGLEGVQ